MAKKAKVDFMLIVLNGEPFIEAWLKTYEPHANKVFIIEGTDHERFSGMPKDLRRKCHTKDGHSVDNTREIIRAYNSKKVVLIDQGPHGNGFWPSKHHMVKQVNSRVEAGWLWEADYDEFLFQADIDKILTILKQNKKQKVWQFKVMNFWKSASHVLEGAWVTPFRRIFRWQSGQTKFTTHRPPTTNAGGLPNTLPYALFHYNYLLRKDAEYKPAYHGEVYNKRWFEKNWEIWTPKNKDTVERKGIGPPRWRNTHTVHRPNLRHPEFVQPVIERLTKEKIILS